MKRYKRVLLVAVAYVSATFATAYSMAVETDRFEALAELPFEQNRSTPETAKTFMEELDFQQATQAYPSWAMPLISGSRSSSGRLSG